jgi:TolB-like protein
MFRRIHVHSTSAVRWTTLALVALALPGTVAGQAVAAAKLPTVAVMPLQPKGVTASNADVITDAIATQLQQVGNQRVLERAQMDQIFREQGFQKSGACDGSECALEMGKLLSVDRIMIGSVGLLGRTYTLNLRLVSVGTGEVLRSDMKSYAGTIDEVLTKLVPETVGDLTRGLDDGARSASSPAQPTAASKESSRSHWGWWVATGALAVGGATAAAVLLSGGSGSSSSGSQGSAQPYNSVTVQW